MIRLRHKILLHSFQALDQVILIVVLLGCYLLFPSDGQDRSIAVLLERRFDGQEVAGGLILVAGWYAVFATTVHYQGNRFTSLASQAIELLRAGSLATFLLFIVMVTFERRGLGNAQIIVFWAASTSAAITMRVLVRLMLGRVRSSGKNSRHILFVGSDARAAALARGLARRPELGYRIEGFLVEDEVFARARGIPLDWPILGPTSQLQRLLEEGVVDEVMICLPLAERFAQIHHMVRLCQERGVVVRVQPDAFDVKMLSKSQIEVFEGEYIVTFFRENLLAQLLLKRLLDLTLSGILLVILAPLLLVVAIAVKLDTPGPVLFAQERVGMNRRRFRLLKFRSMVVNAEQLRASLESMNEMDGPVFKVANDPRITRVGRFIRRTSIDELPQLFNVLIGEMSLVGPRPPLASEVDQYEWLNRRRISVMPGITCLWQVSGRNDLSFKEWMELDQRYIENWSLWLDLKILARTVPVVVFGKGAR